MMSRTSILRWVDQRGPTVAVSIGAIVLVTWCDPLPFALLFPPLFTLAKRREADLRLTRHWQEWAKTNGLDGDRDLEQVHLGDVVFEFRSTVPRSLRLRDAAPNTGTSLVPYGSPPPGWAWKGADLVWAPSQTPPDSSLEVADAVSTIVARRLATDDPDVVTRWWTDLMNHATWGKHPLVTTLAVHEAARRSSQSAHARDAWASWFCGNPAQVTAAAHAIPHAARIEFATLREAARTLLAHDSPLPLALVDALAARASSDDEELLLDVMMRCSSRYTVLSALRRVGGRLTLKRLPWLQSAWRPEEQRAAELALAVIHDRLGGVETGQLTLARDSGALVQAHAPGELTKPVGDPS